MTTKDILQIIGCVLIFSGACKIVFSAYGISGFSGFLFPLAIPIAMEVFLHRNFARPYAFMIAKRTEAFLITCGGLITASFLTLYRVPNWELLSFTQFDGVTGLRSLTVGIFLGIAFRIIVNSNSLLSLQPRSTEVQKRLLVLTIAASVLLIPLPPTPIVFVSIYLFGIALGIFLHFAARTVRRSRARRLQSYLMTTERLRPDKNQELSLTQDEKRAITLYAKEKHRKLRKFLDSLDSQTTTLVIIKACMYRSLGLYLLGIEALVTELNSLTRRKDLDSKLYCLKALCHGELEQKNEMWESLDTALGTKPDCMLTNLTYGLRLAEDDSKEWKSNKALEYIRGALQINLSRPPFSEDLAHLAEEIVGVSVPVTWSLLLDTYAYALLKDGDMRFSRTLLTSCISIDPGFSSPYLHLGEWYIKRDKETGLRPEEHLEARMLARVSLLTAKIIEGKRNSLIKKRAEMLLEEI